MKTLEALPAPENVTTNDRDAVTAARAEYEALSEYAKNHYVPTNLREKLEKCEQKLEKIDSDMAKGRELARRIGHLPEPSEIALSDEPEIAELEALRDSYTADELAQCDPAALKKLIDCRNAITGLKAQQAVQEYIDQQIKPQVDLGEYDEAHQKEIDAIIKELEDKIKELTENGNPDGSPVTQEQIDALIAQAKEKIGKVKTVHNLAAEAFEKKLKEFKAPSALKVTDKDSVNKLLADYNALSAKAKQQVDTEYIASGETYKSRLDALRMKIEALEKELAQAKKDAKDYVHHSAKIKPTYYAESGINETYEGIDDMIKSGHYEKAEVNKLTKIRNDADAKIDDKNLTDIPTIKKYRDDAVKEAAKVRDSQRLKADAYEKKIDAMGPVIDLSRTKADTVKALRKEYEALPSYSKKYVSTNKTAAGDTYLQRLQALEARIDKMAADDAKVVTKLINSLPKPDSVKLSHEGRIKEVRNAYEALTKEAKAKVTKETLNKLKNVEKRLEIEKKKAEIQKNLKDYVKARKSNTSYYKDQLKKVDKALNNGLKAIGKTKTVAAAQNEYKKAVKAINAVQTKAQRLRAKGTKKNFNQMRFRTTQQTNNTIYLRWEKVSGISGYRLYGGIKGQKMKMIRQYDYSARSGKISGLKPKTTYQFVLYAFTDVDRQIIHTHETPVVYATTTGGDYGNVTGVYMKVNNNQPTRSGNPSCTLKKGKTAQIKAVEIVTGKKLIRYNRIKYESTNTKVAKVNASGKVTAVGKGSCWIRVYSQSGVFRNVKVVVK